MKITLPWFPPVLHPNKRHHYHVRNPVFQEAKQAAFVIAQKNPIQSTDGRIALSLLFFPPCNRKRDLDGCLSACKAFLDGLAAGWGVDDSQFRPITIDFAEKRRGGEIEVDTPS